MTASSISLLSLIVLLAGLILGPAFTAPPPPRNLARCGGLFAHAINEWKSGQTRWDGKLGRDLLGGGPYRAVRKNSSAVTCKQDWSLNQIPVCSTLSCRFRLSWNPRGPQGWRVSQSRVLWPSPSPTKPAWPWPWTGCCQQAGATFLSAHALHPLDQPAFSSVGFLDQHVRRAVLGFGEHDAAGHRLGILVPPHSHQSLKLLGNLKGSSSGNDLDDPSSRKSTCNMIHLRSPSVGSYNTRTSAGSRASLLRICSVLAVGSEDSIYFAARRSFSDVWPLV